MKALPGGWEPETDIVFDFETAKSVKSPMPNVFVFESVLNDRECALLNDLMSSSPNFESVSIQGRKDIVDDRIGSIRTTIWSPQLAQQFLHKFYPLIKDLKCDEFTPTDWWQGNKSRNEWEFVGVTPMMRFMEYGKDGQHYAHYDAAYIYPNDNYRSLLSFVVYLTDNDDGCTRIIGDNQDKVPVWDRDHNDWIRQASEYEVIFKSKPVKGNVLVFPHRMCHDVEQFTGTKRRIIRGDILFKAKTPIGEGTKVRVKAGDRDTVLFDPFGTVKNLQPNGDCEILLKSRICFKDNIKNISIDGSRKYDEDLIVYDWKENEKPW